MTLLREEVGLEGHGIIAGMQGGCQEEEKKGRENVTNQIENQYFSKNCLAIGEKSVSWQSAECTQRVPARVPVLRAKQQSKSHRHVL